MGIIIAHQLLLAPLFLRTHTEGWALCALYERYRLVSPLQERAPPFFSTPWGVGSHRGLKKSEDL
jgi:hypothetical protein